MYLNLFLCFLQVGLFSIGGGYAAIPLIQNHVVQQNSWMTMAEFTDLITIAEMTPGPIAINCATFVGVRLGGIAGAIAATFGCITPSLLIVSALFYVYRRWRKGDLLSGILQSLRPAVVALIASAGLSILIQVLFSGGSMSLQNLSLSGAALVLLSLYLLRRRRLSPILTMSLCGLLALFAELIRM